MESTCCGAMPAGKRPWGQRRSERVWANSALSDPSWLEAAHGRASGSGVRRARRPERALACRVARLHGTASEPEATWWPNPAQPRFGPMDASYAIFRELFIVEKYI